MFIPMTLIFVFFLCFAEVRETLLIGLAIVGTFLTSLAMLGVGCWVLYMLSTTLSRAWG